LGSFAASLFQDQRSAHHCVVVPQNAPERAALYRAHGWHILTNPAPERGQGSSLAIAARHLLSTQANAAMILLADMPFITEAYLLSMIKSVSADQAVMSQCADILQPPALFPRSAFSQLTEISSDSGARAIFKCLPNTAAHPICASMARDIDTQAALASAQESPLHV
jgi:molybdenum cofactor cytidylyltransferase